MSFKNPFKRALESLKEKPKRAEVIVNLIAPGISFSDGAESFKKDALEKGKELDENTLVKIDADWIKGKAQEKKSVFSNYFDQKKKEYYSLKKLHSIEYNDISINLDEVKENPEKLTEAYQKIKEKLREISHEYVNLEKSHRALDNTPFIDPKNVEWSHEQKDELRKEMEPLFRKFEVLSFIYEQLNTLVETKE